MVPGAAGTAPVLPLRAVWWKLLPSWVHFTSPVQRWLWLSCFLPNGLQAQVSIVASLRGKVGASSRWHWQMSHPPFPTQFSGILYPLWGSQKSHRRLLALFCQILCHIFLGPGTYKCLLATSCWWLIPVILATQEAESGGSQFKASLGK
jgi:hypothetical protein